MRAATPVLARGWWQGDRPVSRVDPRFLSFAVDTAQVVGGEFWAPSGQGRGCSTRGRCGPTTFPDRACASWPPPSRPPICGWGGRTPIAPSTACVRGTPNGGGETRPLGADRRPLGRPQRVRPHAGSEAGVHAQRRPQRPRPERRLGSGERPRPYRPRREPRGSGGGWELGNEPNAFPLLHRTWLSAERYAADLHRASALLAELRAPGKLAGPSSAYWPMLGEGRSFSNEVIERAGHLLGVVSWHYYPQQSHRCPVATRRARPGVLPPPAQLVDVEHWAKGWRRRSARTPPTRSCGSGKPGAPSVAASRGCPTPSPICCGGWIIWGVWPAAGTRSWSARRCRAATTG